MISTRLCWISSEPATFPGESSFLDSRWWWRGTNTKESKEFVEMPRLVMQLQSYHQECKPMSMRLDAKRRTILSQHKAASKLSSFSRFNLSAQGQFLISEAYRKLSSQKWNSWRNLRIQLCPDHSNLVRLDQVLVCASLWISRTKSLIRHWRNQNAQVQLTISVREINKLNNRPLPKSTTRWLRSEEKLWRSKKQRKRRLSRKKLSATSSKTDSNSVLSAALLWFLTLNRSLKCVQSRWIARGRN